MIQQEPNEVAADLLSQAEHDARACSVLVTPSTALAERVAAEVEKQLKRCHVEKWLQNQLPIMA